MSWFDDESMAEILGEMGQDFQESSEISTVESLMPGDLIADRYIVEDVVSPGRAKVRLHGVQKFFEIRLLPELNSRAGRVREELEFVSSTTGFLNSEALGFITDFGVCDGCGGFLVGEWVEGRALGEILNTGRRVELIHVLKFVHQVGGALASLHEVGFAHGLRDGADVVRTKDGRWNLSATSLRPSRSFPPQFPLPRPPELNSIAEATTQSDQYTFAAIVFMMLMGERWSAGQSTELSSRRTDAPAAIDKAMARALASKPDERFPRIEEFQELILEIGKAWHRPKPAEPTSEQWTPQPSMLVTSSEPLGVPSLKVDFANLERLRLEYRQNLVAGGLFVPTELKLTRNQQIELDLGFTPQNARVQVEARVAQVSGPGQEPIGVGLFFEGEARESVLAFLRQCDPVLGLSPNDQISAAIQLNRDTPVDAAEAFLLSRVMMPVHLSVLRAAFQGLPFDFEDTLTSLLQKKFVAVKSAPMAARPKTPAPSPQTLDIPTEAFKAEFDKSIQNPVEAALEKADSYEERGNFRAAIDSLEAAHVVQPNTKFLLKLAILYATYFKDWDKAQERVAAAFELSPNDPDVKAALESLESLQLEEFHRPIYEVVQAGAKFRFLMLVPETRKLWFEAHIPGPTGRREIHMVDYARGRGSLNKRAKDPVKMSVVAANPPEFAAVELLRENAPKTAMGRREKLLEKKLANMDDGPWFRSGPTPAATSKNSKFLVFDRNPAIFEEGLFIVHQGKDIAPLRLDPDHTRGKCPVLSPDEDGTVAWVRVAPGYGIYVAEPFQMASLVATLDTEAEIWWRDSLHLLAFLRASGELLLVSRRGGEPKTLLKGAGVARVFAIDAEMNSAVRVTNTTMDWVDLNTGEVRGTLNVEQSPKGALLRGDGFVALHYDDCVKVYRFGKKSRASLDLIVDPANFGRDARWGLGHPLVLMTLGDSKAGVVRFDPKQL